MDTRTPNYEVWTVTPEQAQKWLDEHSNYRKLSASRVASYLHEMRSGLWLIGQPIIFDETGDLADGQHRLRAIVEYGSPVRVIPLTGVPKDSVATFDQTYVRNAKQVMGHHRGHVHPKAAEILRVFATMPAVSHRAILGPELLNLYDTYQHEIDIVCEWFSKKTRGISRAGVATAFARALLNHPRQKQTLQTMVEEMYSLEFTKSTNARILAKFLLAEARTKEGGSGARNDYMRATRAIRAELEGEKLTKLYSSVIDPFPLNAEI